VRWRGTIGAVGLARDVRGLRMCCLSQLSQHICSDGVAANSNQLLTAIAPSCSLMTSQLLTAIAPSVH
jgi:hypothetical protein